MDHTLEQYKTLFDEEGKFKHSLFNQEMPKEEFEVVEETESGSGDQEEEEEFNHIKTPLYTIKLQSSYEVLADSDLDISHIYSTFLLPMNVNDSLSSKYHLCFANITCALQMSFDFLEVQTNLCEVLSCIKIR